MLVIGWMRGEEVMMGLRRVETEDLEKGVRCGGSGQGKFQVDIQTTDCNTIH